MPVLYWSVLIWCLQQLLVIPGENYFNAANHWYEQGQYTKAMSYYKKVFQDKMLAGKALYNAGNAAYQEKKYEQALDFYEQALKQLPDDDDVWNNLELARKKVVQLQKDEQSEEMKSSPEDQHKKQLSGDDQLLRQAQSEEYRYRPVINQESRRKLRASISSDVFNLPPQELFQYIKEQTKAGYPFKPGSSLKKNKDLDTVIDW